MKLFIVILICFTGIRSFAQQDNAKHPPIKQGGETVTKAAAVSLPIKRDGGATEANAVAAKPAVVPIKTISSSGQNASSTTNSAIAQNKKTAQVPSSLSAAQAQQLQTKKMTNTPAIDPQTQPQPKQ